VERLNALDTEGLYDGAHDADYRIWHVKGLGAQERLPGLGRKMRCEQ
jgi:hypothetical protein